MKKLIKSDICGSVNSAQMHYSQLKRSAFTAESKKKKKKKKPETRFAPRRGCKTRKPNIALVSVWLALFIYLFIYKWHLASLFT